MATSPLNITILEDSQISPTPSSFPPVSLQLTFFDIPWLLLPPSQPLFFYRYSKPNSSSQFFTSTVLPKLKESLSLALAHFPTFAGKIATSRTSPTTPELIYSDGDSVRVTVAEVSDYSSDDFDHLCSNSRQKDAHVLHGLVPTRLGARFEGDNSLSDLLAVQITCFPRAGGFSVGLAYPDVVCDQRTFNNFLKAWASLCKFGGGLSERLRPSYDRTHTMDRLGLEPILVTQWWERGGVSTTYVAVSSEMVRATFLMSPVDIDNARNWIVAQCKKNNSPRPVLLSAYVVVCGFVWACLAKAQYEPAHKRASHQGPVYFGFIAGGLSRLRYQVPANYFGNCVAFGRAEVATAQDLVGESGVVAAAAAIAETVKRLDGDVLGGAERWIGEWEEVVGSDLHVNVVGSPKVDLYETDFGWGRPVKIEEVGIDGKRGVWLCESRDLKGGIEIGVALSNPKMDAFSKLFWKGLSQFSSDRESR